MSKYLVTGGAGFIGSNIVERLVSDGEEVVVLDNLSEGSLEKIKPWMSKLQFIEGDIKDLDVLRMACDGVDYVFHEAAQRSVPKSVDDPTGTHDNNVTGTFNVLTAAKEKGVKRVVIASSSSVYGENDDDRQVETADLNPVSPYAVSKLMKEMYCRMFSRTYGLETVCLRYFNVYGPKQDPASQYSAVIPILTMKLLAGEKAEIHWHGDQSRDFSYVSNVVEANLAAAKAEIPAQGEAYNVGNGENTSINELYAQLQEMLGTNIEPTRTPMRQGDVLHTHADISKAVNNLKWKPGVMFEEGLKKSVTWYKENLFKGEKQQKGA